MKLLHTKTNEQHEAVIELMQNKDWEVIRNNDQFEFNWITEKKYLVHKIKLKLEEDIFGLISLEDIPKELRIHIRLIEVNKNHKGKNKEFDHVAGCLLAFSCKLAFDKGYGGFVSLHSKTAIIDLYKEKYGFQPFGRNLYVELSRSQALINKYLNHE